jgi:oligopeptide/dipeptide ABC transporter ATP-binding protein
VTLRAGDRAHAQTINGFASPGELPVYDVGVPPLLELRALTVNLPTPSGWVCPVNGVDLALAPGEALGIVGESGSGKTMLALSLMGLLPEGARLTGEAWFAPADAAAGSRRDLVSLGERERASLRGHGMAMIFQEPMTSLNPVMRVGTQVAEAIRAHERSRSGGSLSRREIESRVVEALSRARVPEPELRAKQFPHQLSGGLRQRVMIAMALAGGPRLLIADEPTTALDVTVQEQILELLSDLRRELGLALLFITHDLAVVSKVAERIAVLYAGRVVESGPASEVLSRPRHPYTEGLLRASPSLTRRKLEPIPGGVPALGALPPGCSFEPRCAYRRDTCATAVPGMRSAGAGHEARCILVDEARG